MTDTTNNAAHSDALNGELTVDIQYALAEVDSESEEPPGRSALSQWAQTAYGFLDIANKYSAEVTIRIVSNEEMRELNNQYRGKDKTTNVLSFSFVNEFAAVAEMAPGLLGDIVICHSVVLAQAKEQAKVMSDHYAHMVTHGILHLCGYDHQLDQEAEQMEAIEAKILALGNIPNPYLSNS